MACAWFLEIIFVHASMCVCLPSRALITSGVIWCDIGHECGLSNTASHAHQAKKSK